MLFFFSSRRRHTRFDCDWSSDVCSSDLLRRLVRNMIYDGVLAKLLGIDPALMDKALNKQLGKKAKAVALNAGDRKSTRLNSSHSQISYAVFCLKKKNINYSHSFNT